MNCVWGGGFYALAFTVEGAVDANKLEQHLACVHVKENGEKKSSL